MRTFELDSLLAKRERETVTWLEFLRTTSLSMGVYHLKTRQPDPQRPHTEDEVYYVVSGRGQFQTGNEERSVEAGDILFVERNLEHRFLDITEDLTLLVFFAPAEGSAKQESASLN